MFTPALRALKRDLPNARLTVITMIKEAAEMLGRNPYADEIINFNFPEEGAFRSLRFVLGLRRRRFDVSILAYPANRPEYNIISTLAGAKYRVGHHYNHMDWVCLNWWCSAGAMEHDDRTNIDENLRAVELATGVLSTDHQVDFVLSDAERSFADTWFAEQELTGKRLIGIHPGGTVNKNHIRKRWTVEQFAGLGQILTEDPDTRVLVFGGEVEADLKEQLASRIGERAMAVHTDTLFKSSGLIAHCAHFVSNDSLLLHIAGALAVPTTGIFGPTSAPQVRIPGANREEVSLHLPCQPCFYHSPRHIHCHVGGYPCIGDLSPETVAAHVNAALARG
jgi:ADP-heptose:LPS heptosyltransferase